MISIQSHRSSVKNNHLPVREIILEKTDRFIERMRNRIPWLRGARRRFYRTLRRALIIFTIFTVIIAIFSILTNPFTRFSTIKDPIGTLELVDGQFVLPAQVNLRSRHLGVFRALAWMKSGWHIFANRFSHGQKAEPGAVDTIIDQIHARRFNPELPFLISGDHFSVLYPRSLGIFYHSILDPRTARNEFDWHYRQAIYLKTTLFALETFHQAGDVSTTIIPIGRSSVVPINVYAYPSDTLYSLLFALSSMKDASIHSSIYPFMRESPSSSAYTLATTSAADELLVRYKTSLAHLYNQYFEHVWDETTGLVQQDILLSGQKDIAKRYGAFYDNVILWRTTQLAQELGILAVDESWLEAYKERILATYWLEDEGYFLEDLSTPSRTEKWYSSDWIIAYQTGFLRPDNPQDLPYLERSVSYISDQAIDRPFGLQYHPDYRLERAYPAVKWFAPDYGSRAIWSHMGIEYIKLLTHLGISTGNVEYLQRGQEQLSAYTYNIKRFDGYPEVYSPDGDFFRQRTYLSVRQTGWVVNYEQAREMVAAYQSLSDDQVGQSSGNPIQLTE